MPPGRIVANLNSLPQSFISGFHPLLSPGFSPGKDRLPVGYCGVLRGQKQPFILIHIELLKFKLHHNLGRNAIHGRGARHACRTQCRNVLVRWNSVRNRQPCDHIPKCTFAGGSSISMPVLRTFAPFPENAYACVTT